MSDSQRAQLAPAVRRIPSANELLGRLQDLLDQKFCMQVLPEFSIIVEGATDRDYLTHAAEMAKSTYGEDLLAVPSHLSEAGATVAVVTPLNPAAPQNTEGRERGGIPQVVRLAEELRPYVFTLTMFQGLLFVFDHDTAGLEAQKKIKEFGYCAGQNSITLNPEEHPRACGSKQVVIEDLLSLSIQQRFFDTGGAWCSVDYKEGRVVRFHWRSDSKFRLRDFVCRNAGWEDVYEIGRILMRVRTIFGLPVSESLFCDV